MKTLQWVVRLVSHNFWWKVLALAIAVLIWAVVASEPELSTYTTAHVEYKNLPDGLELSSEPVTQIVLELRGPSGELRGLGDGGQHPAAILDMSNAAPGERTFPIGAANVRLSRGVHIVRAIPSQVRLAFEQRLERSVPVVVRLRGEFHDRLPGGQRYGRAGATGDCGPAEPRGARQFSTHRSGGCFLADDERAVRGERLCRRFVRALPLDAHRDRDGDHDERKRIGDLELRWRNSFLEPMAFAVWPAGTRWIEPRSTPLAWRSAMTRARIRTPRF